jgi:hypothetical protein
MSQKNTKNAPGGGKGAPKGKKGAAGGKKAEDEREETLQAVVWTPSLNMIPRNAQSLHRYSPTLLRLDSTHSH